MRFETRNLGGKKSLILILESEEESKVVDEYLGSTIPTRIAGSIELSNGMDDHYIHLWNPITVPEGRAAV